MSICLLPFTVTSIVFSQCHFDTTHILLPNAFTATTPPAATTAPPAATTAPPAATTAPPAATTAPPAATTASDGPSSIPFN